MIIATASSFLGFRSSSSPFQDPPRRHRFTNDRLSYLVTHIIPIFLSMQQLRNSRQAPPGPSRKMTIPRILLITSSDHGRRQKDPQPSIICRLHQSSVHFIKGYLAPAAAGIFLSAQPHSSAFVSHPDPLCLSASRPKIHLHVVFRQRMPENLPDAFHSLRSRHPD